MALRVVDAALPADRMEDIRGLEEEIEGFGVREIRRGALEDGRSLLTVVTEADGTEAVLDLLEARFGGADGFHVTVHAIEAALPRPDPDEAEPPTEEEEASKGRISREELYEDVREMASLDRSFVLMMILATVVAVIGLLLDNVAIVIGSMVIAPLIGPSVGLSLSATLADRDLAWRALQAKGAGLAVGAAVGVVGGLLLFVDPGAAQLAIRTRVSLFDVGLGLAVGAAGALSVTTGVSEALVGVMVAVALLPPLAAFGLLLGDGHVDGAMGALLLLATYLISINLAGVAAFFAQGVQPRRWWEAEQARRSTLVALVVWVGLLVALVAIILFSQGDPLGGLAP